MESNSVCNHTSDNKIFVYHEYDYRLNWTTRVLLPINHKNYNFREKKNSQESQMYRHVSASNVK